MKKTANYQLSQWEFEDQILMADFNNDNKTIDAALHTLAGQVAGKADSAAVTNLTAVVNAKAEQNALAAEETARINGDDTEKAAREAADTAITQTLRGENCWVKLSDKTLAAAASSYSWAIANPARYAELRCVFETACTGNIHFNVQNGASIRLPGSSTATTQQQMLGTATSGAGGWIQLAPMGGSGHLRIYYEIGGMSEDGRFFSPSNYLAGVSQTYNSLSTVKIFSDTGVFPEGSRFLLYGLKK